MKINGKILSLSVSLALLMLLFGCTNSNTTYVGKRNWINKMSQSSLTTGDLSYISNQFLISNVLDEEFKDNPDKVITLLAEEIEKPTGNFFTPNDNIRDVLGVLIDLCMYEALNSKENIAIKYWLSCSYYSFRFMFDKKITPESLPNYTLGTAATLRYYNISTAEVFSYIKDHKTSFYSKPNLPTILGRVQFSAPKSDLLWKIDTFKNFVIGYDYLPSKFKSHAFNPGIGVPVIGLNDITKRTNTADREMMINITYPFTFLINYQFDSKSDIITATPEIFDSFNDEYTNIEGIKIPLAKDFTIVLAEMLNTESKIDGIKFMFRSDKMGDLQGLYLLSHYDPNKIPVVLIHGLFSEPRTWAQMLNTLLNNRIIRQNYQFWVYSYPTGLPLYASLNNFRQSLSEVQKKYDPESNNKKFNQMVLIGHSMGGIITRFSIQSSEGTKFVDKLAKASTKMNYKDLTLTDKDRETIEDLIVFESLPFVKRAIMISTPHRGSETSLTLYSKIGIYLISLPKDLVDKTSSVISKLSLKRDKSVAKSKFALSTMPTGIDNLSPKNLFLAKSNELRFDKNIKVHSIMGNLEKEGQTGGTDGVVPYWSSHLDNAETEFIVKSDHSAHKKQKAIKEVIRILKEHIKDNEL